MRQHEHRSRARLPDDGRYWSALADRIEAGAEGALASRRTTPQIWWARTDLAPALAVAALILVGSVWWLVPARGAADDATTAVLTRALQPDSRLADRLLAADTPPHIGALLAASSSEGE